VVIARLSWVEIRFQQRFGAGHARDAVLCDLSKSQMQSGDRRLCQIVVIQALGHRAQPTEELRSIP
jgi:hypothetical protein